MANLFDLHKFSFPQIVKPVLTREQAKSSSKEPSARRPNAWISFRRNQILTIVAIVLVGVGAFSLSYYLSRNTNTRNELTPDEKNLAEQLDKMNSEPSASDQSPFQPADVPPTQQTAGTETNYEVKPGDSLSTIAASYTGDGDRWPELAEANAITNPNYVEPGMALKIPAGFKKQETSQTQPDSPQVTNQQTSAQHTVLRGETLWSLAQKYYGSGFEWYKIRDANQNKVKTLSNGKPWIEVGTQLSIPLAAATSSK